MVLLSSVLQGDAKMLITFHVLLKKVQGLWYRKFVIRDTFTGCVLLEETFQTYCPKHRDAHFQVCII